MKHITTFILACLLLMFTGCQKTPPGIVYLEGIVTLDGNPIGGVNVILHPRNDEGTAAGGMTDARGRFTVTTHPAPVGTGAMAGVYDVTFSKVETPVVNVSMMPMPAPAPSAARQTQTPPQRTYIVPQRYGRPRTSGLEPITVEAGGNNRFTFALFSESVPNAGGGVQDSVRTENRETRTAEQEEAEQARRAQIQRERLEREERERIERERIEREEQENAEREVRERLEQEERMRLEQEERERREREEQDRLEQEARERRERFPDIFAAARRGTVEDVKFFIDARVDIGVRDSSRNTLLHIAVQFNPHLDVLEYLLNVPGAHVNARNFLEETPLDIVVTRPDIPQREERYRILREHDGRRGHE